MSHVELPNQEHGGIPNGTQPAAGVVNDAHQTAHERQASSMADRAAKEKRKHLMNVRVEESAG